MIASGQAIIVLAIGPKLRLSPVRVAAPIVAVARAIAENAPRGVESQRGAGAVDDTTAADVLDHPGAPRQQVPPGRRRSRGSWCHPIERPRGFGIGHSRHGVVAEVRQTLEHGAQGAGPDRQRSRRSRPRRSACCP